ncbi:conserved hypothetical protein [gamma proteobacterium HdN1]|nr:conserved hypothetical protein [gamma proteobacterium HdN1]
MASRRNRMFQRKLLSVSVMFAALSLAACGDSSDHKKTTEQPQPEQPQPEPPKTVVYKAIIASTAADYSSSDISIAATKAPFDAIRGYNIVDQSDYGVDAFEGSFYRIGRYNIDTLTRYDITAPQLPVWQFSTKASTETTTRNPYDLAFVNAEKAYLIRYEGDTAWIINPSVLQSEESAFKIGELNLSSYNDADGSPEAVAGVIVGEKLFVVMQRLDKTAGWAPGDPYIAVFDINTNTEIDTDPNDNPENVKGIKLEIKNPTSIDVVGDTLYVSGIGNYAPLERTGGIQGVNVSNYSTRIIRDDSAEGADALGQTSGIAIISPTLGYFKGYVGWQNEGLYQFNPETGEVVTEPVAGLTGLMISTLKKAPDNSLWVGIGDAVSPRVEVLDTTNNTKLGQVDLLRSPSEIAFTSTLEEVVPQ